jgi:transcriptional regulator with XRE-family HTH domain
VFKAMPLLELLELAEQRERWNEQVGAKLRQARESAGVSQRHLADRLGVTQVYVSNVERGKGVSTDQLRLFTDAIQKELDQGGSDALRKGERKRKQGKQ